MSFRRFASWNLIGQGFPLVVALFTYPLLLHFAGVERVGAMSLAWTLVGYLGLLDFGLGRVITRFVALGRARRSLASDWPSIERMAYLIAAAAAAVTLTLWLTSHSWIRAIGLAPSIEGEAFAALPFLMLSIAPTALGAYLTGVLDGFEAFRQSGLSRIGIALWGYVAPVVVAAYEPSLTPMIASVALGRWVGLLVLVTAVRRFQPPRTPVKERTSPRVGAALREGAWVAVSNVIAPLMTVCDRFVLALVAGVAMVPIYSISFDLISKALVIPTALLSSVFPTLSAAGASADARLVADRTAVRAAGWIAAAMGACCIVVAGAAYLLLSLWLGRAFADSGHQTLRWLAVGVLVNGLAYIPSGMLQSQKRSKLIALFHLAELPPYLVVLYFLTVAYGPLGVAIAWILRAVLDIVLLLWAIRAHAMADLSAVSSRALPVVAMAMLSALIGSWLPPAWWSDAMLGTIGLVASILFANRLLHRTEGVGLFPWLKQLAARPSAEQRGG